MSTINILHRWTGAVLLTAEAATVREAMEAACRSGANLIGAIGIDLIIARTRILPEGRLIGWKKCADGVIVKLVIPEDSKRSHAFGRKCRAAFACRECAKCHIIGDSSRSVSKTGWLDI